MLSKIFYREHKYDFTFRSDSYLPSLSEEERSLAASLTLVSKYC